MYLYVCLPPATGAKICSVPPGSSEGAEPAGEAKEDNNLRLRPSEGRGADRFRRNFKGRCVCIEMSRVSTLLARKGKPDEDIFTDED